MSFLQRWGQSGWPEVSIAVLGEWKFTAMAAGGQCAIIAGIKNWPPWCVPCYSAAQKHSRSPSLFLLSSTKTTVPSGTIHVTAKSRISGSARRIVINRIYARTLKLQGSSVMVRNANFIPIIARVFQSELMLQGKLKNIFKNTFYCFSKEVFCVVDKL